VIGSSALGTHSGKAALDGEEVIIASHGKAQVKLVPCVSSTGLKRPESLVGVQLDLTSAQADAAFREDVSPQAGAANLRNGSTSLSAGWDRQLVSQLGWRGGWCCAGEHQRSVQAVQNPFATDSDSSPARAAAARPTDPAADPPTLARLLTRPQLVAGPPWSSLHLVSRLALTGLP